MIVARRESLTEEQQRKISITHRFPPDLRFLQSERQSLLVDTAGSAVQKSSKKLMI